jgi:hypothetical protein
VILPEIELAQCNAPLLYRPLNNYRRAPTFNDGTAINLSAGAKVLFMTGFTVVL